MKCPQAVEPSGILSMDSYCGYRRGPARAVVVAPNRALSDDTGYRPDRA